MLEHRTKIHDGGRLVVPAAYRQALGLAPGEEVILRLEKDELRVYSARQALARVRRLVKKHAGGRSLVDELIAERRKEAADE